MSLQQQQFVGEEAGGVGGAHFGADGEPQRQLGEAGGEGLEQQDGDAGHLSGGGKGVGGSRPPVVHDGSVDPSQLQRPEPHVASQSAEGLESGRVQTVAVS